VYLSNFLVLSLLGMVCYHCVIMPIIFLIITGIRLALGIKFGLG
jgi:hypothetical protein